MHAFRRIFAFALGVFALQANAAEIRGCDTFEANARNLAFPYAEATRSYANGSINLINLFLDEPACCGAHLMVLFPAGDEGYLDCALISRKGSLGYSDIRIMQTVAGYDAARGLTLVIPTGIYDGDASQPSTLEITVNQSTGRIMARDQ